MTFTCLIIYILFFLCTLKSEDLDRCLKYIRDEAPIVIHLTQNCLSYLVRPEETHYRNMFEVNSTGGNPSFNDRIRYESNMFSSYYDGASAYQRVKYGCLNLTGDIEGVAEVPYGDRAPPPGIPAGESSAPAAYPRGLPHSVPEYR